MLNIYYGRESLDREQFIFEQIKAEGGRTIVIVPDQYTLESEKQALRLMKVEALMDVEILSLSRLCQRVLDYAGTGNRTFINSYGRNMLLTKVIKNLEPELKVYGGAGRKETFIEAAGDFVAEMKQGNITPESIIEAAKEEKGLFAEKLEDMGLIYSEYEQALGDTYNDSEDRLALFAEKTGQVPFLKENRVWIYNFDSFTGKNLDIIQQLIMCCKEVNVVITRGRINGVFPLSDSVMRKLRNCAEELGSGCCVEPISDNYLIDGKSPGISAIEKNFFNPNPLKESDFSGVEIRHCLNTYTEAENAAAYILYLVREKKLRYRDILLLNNDKGERTSIIKRVFAEYGIHVFDDAKRTVLSSPISVFVLTLAETVINGYRTGDFIQTLKTGFTDLSRVDIEKLENYGIKYKIRGTMWTRPFKYGEFEYGEKGFARIENIRKQAMKIFEGFEKIEKGSTYGAFLREYYSFLTKETLILPKIKGIIYKQEAAGLNEQAEETAQVLKSVMDIFSQIDELFGEEQFDGDEFLMLLRAGLSCAEIGVVPQASDIVMTGTFQRTRQADIKALVVIGANAGVIPMAVSEDPIFAPEELEKLGSGVNMESAEITRIREEEMAIYRNLSKPEKYLWISYADTDAAGDGQQPSEIIEEIKNIFPNIEEQSDVLSGEDIDRYIGGRTNTLRHYAEAKIDEADGNKVSPKWKEVGDWLKKNHPEGYNRINRALEYTNTREPLPKEITEALYTDSGSMRISPSGLEKYSRCPFSHFVSYGLRPEEKRIWESGGREIGDFYHNVIMQVTEILSEKNIWGTIEPEELEKLIEQVCEKEKAEYREGLFASREEETYKFRRAKTVLIQIIKILVYQHQKGQIRTSLFEEPFARGEKLDALTRKIGDTTVYIEGKIDRIDIQQSGRVRVTDYKTGMESFDIDEAKAGYRLQLMLYLAAAKGERKPAGVFYFQIHEPAIDLAGLSTQRKFTKSQFIKFAEDNGVDVKSSWTKKKIKEEVVDKLGFDPEEEPKSINELREDVRQKIRKNLKLNGILVDTEQNIEEIAGEFSGVSDIIAVRKNKADKKEPDKKTYQSTATDESAGVLLTESEFAEVERAVEDATIKLCENLLDGRIDVAPKISKGKTPCSYCEYKSICKFDTEFKDAKYIQVKK